MKIFSDDPKSVKFWSMRADRTGRLLLNVFVSALAAFLLSLALPAGDLAQATTAVMFAIFVVGADLRDRVTEVFHQNRDQLKDRP
jgi:hypothetical protein